MVCGMVFASVFSLGLGVSETLVTNGSSAAARNQVKAKSERDARPPEIVGTDSISANCHALVTGPGTRREPDRTPGEVRRQRRGRRGARPALEARRAPRPRRGPRAGHDRHRPARRFRQVLAANPRAVVCCELYFFEANRRSYPEDHPWWFRDKKGQKVSFWRGAYNMDVGNEAYIEHIAQRILAVHDALEGKAGIFLDNLRFDATAKRGWLKPAQKLRAARPEHRRSGQLGLVEHRPGVDRAL